VKIVQQHQLQSDFAPTTYRAVVLCRSFFFFKNFHWRSFTFEHEIDAPFLLLLRTEAHAPEDRRSFAVAAAFGWWCPRRALQNFVGQTGCNLVFTVFAILL
jgi:hypothetical protein